MTSANRFWQRLLSRKQIKNTRVKPRRFPLDFEPLENRFGPTPGIEMGLSVMGFSFANPLGFGVRGDSSEINAVPDMLAAQFAPSSETPAHEPTTLAEPPKADR